MGMGDGHGKLPCITVVVLCLTSYTQISHAGLGPSATARDWCKEKTLQYLTKRGYIPYNWVATTYIEDDNYVTKGEWSIDADEINVECITHKHGNLRAGKYKILDVEILGNGKSAESSNSN